MDPIGTMHSNPSEVIPGLLYIGSKANAQNRPLLDKLGITHILNVTPDMPNTFEHDGPEGKALKYLRIEFDDEVHDARLLGCIPLASEFIEETRKEGGKVLAHCYLGVSRSPALIIGYLIFTGRYTLKDACAHLKNVRAASQPNLGFFEQLLMYERYKRGQLSLELSDFSRYFNVGYLNGDVVFDSILEDYNFDDICIIA